MRKNAKLTLADLLASTPPRSKLTPEELAWDRMPAMGREWPNEGWDNMPQEEQHKPQDGSKSRS